MTKLNGWKMVGAVLVLCALTAIAAPAQTFTTVLNFDHNDGAEPNAPLAQGTDGSFYGTTYVGGGDGFGTVFKTTAQGEITTLHTFANLPTDGVLPLAGLFQGASGSFYGTTSEGGPNLSSGTVFMITPEGKLTILYSFCAQTHCADGAGPYGGLVQMADGNFYGTTYFGGAGGGVCGVDGCGTVFKITPEGSLTTLHSFDFTDGAYPFYGLALGTDGNLYGSTAFGGVIDASPCGFGCGTIFRITPGGALTMLHSFNGTDGARGASGPLVQGSDGNFYGTAFLGGNSSCQWGCGTVFRITPAGALTTLYRFEGGADGNYPQALLEATDGNFWGETINGGDLTCGNPYGCGTLFKITPSGTLTTLHTFGAPAGIYPNLGLLQDTNGIFYGTTQQGGFDVYDGTVFRLDMGFGPFVTFIRGLGKVANTAVVLGQGLRGTTSVSFNGTAAKFVVGADTYLTATVPAGATTGSVTVTTPSGTLTSNVPFRITPQLLSFSPPSGPVGAVVTITGVSLTQTVGVGFGDEVPANFTVNSDLQVTATVPSGAKTGKVGVQTQGGTAISTAVFTVTP
jgi:uncharacterized repeat protein (TIGR03803 family)